MKFAATEGRCSAQPLARPFARLCERRHRSPAKRPKEKALHGRWSTIAALAISAAVLALLPGQASAKGATTDITLNGEQAAFWDGEGRDQAHVPHPALCRVSDPPDPSDTCWEYRINVNQDSWRLRVALSAIFREPGDVHVWSDFLVASEMIFDLQVLQVKEDGTETVVASGSTQNRRFITAYAVEVFVPDPRAGEYTVRVIPTSVTDMAFRMRAKLEKNKPPDTANPMALLSPNLRAIPPYEFNFYTPTVTFGPSSGQHAPAASCMAEEIEDAIAAKLPPPEMCLRYSFGLENAGDGRLDLLFDAARCPTLQGKPDPLNPDDATTCELMQRRWHANGTPQEEKDWNSAGEATFHATHGHWHIQRIFDVKLLQVEGNWKPGGPPPKLDEQPDSGRKLGMLPGNERMADWHRFWPACGADELTKACQHDRDAPPSGEFFLHAGWGDVYEYNRSGNYVPFPQAPDKVGVPRSGYYVLRTTTGPFHDLIESDESDNVSYALVKVSTNEEVKDIVEDKSVVKVDLIERGYGTDPWDPQQKVVEVAP